MVKMEAEIMDDQKYVTRLMRARCSKGTMENYLNVDLDHGIVVGADMQPLMNANDHVSGRHVIHFGCCESDQNPERMFRKGLVGGLLGGEIADALEDVGIMTCKCKPNTPNPWEFVNEDNIVEGAPALMVCSKLTCRYGGIIEIIDPDGNGDIDIPKSETETDIPANPEEWDMIEEIYPGLGDEIHKILQEAGNVVGVEQGYSRDFSMTLPDGTAITLETSFDIKAGNTDVLALESAIKSSIVNHVFTLKGSNYSIDENGNYNIVMPDGKPGLAISFDASSLEMSLGLKTGNDVQINEYTTVHAPIYAFDAGLFGRFGLSTEIGMDTDTPAFSVESVLRTKKSIDNTSQKFEPAFNDIGETATIPESSMEPWHKKGWNWVCDTADSLASGIGTAIDSASEFISDVGEDISEWWNNGGQETVVKTVVVTAAAVAAIYYAPVVAAAAPEILAAMAASSSLFFQYAH